MFLRNCLCFITRSCCLVFSFVLLFSAALHAQPSSRAAVINSKLSPGLKQALSGQGTLSLLLRVDHTATFLQFVAQQKSGVTVTAVYSDYKTIQLRCTASQLVNNLLSYPGILFADLQRKPVEESSIESVDMSLNAISLAQQNFPQLNGSNQVVSVKEHRFDTADVDFTGRLLLTAGTSPTLSSHATAMTTIIGGAGNSYYKGKGVAPYTLLNSTTFDNLLPEADAFYTGNQVTVQNHSYGTGIEYYYGIDAEAHDRSTATVTSLLHVFSAGNSGLNASTTGAYTGIAGLANLTSNAKMAKNLITVGATDSFGVVSPLSSKGPAYDGRVKPELVAMGEDGSSGAAAMVSGAAILVQQAHQVYNAGARAPAALVKAVLLNSADDAGTAGIDFSSGYGQLNANRALQTVAKRQYITGSLSDGQTALHPVTLPANVLSFKATITWTDPPAAANAPRALINDLDLSLLTPSAQTILPWVLSSYPHADSLRKAPRRMTDTLNNNEQVTIDNPAPGVYNLKVTARRIPLGTQAYAIAYSYDTLRLQWMRPQRNDPILAGERNLIRWQSTTGAPSTIEYTLNGSNWLPVAANIPPGTSSIYWQAPNIFGTAQLRISSGALATVSDTVVICQPLNIKVGFNCPDSFMYTWSPYGPGRYQAWRLGAQYMEPVGIVNDTVLVQAKANNPVLNYAVSPMLPDNRMGIRSFTTNYTMQGTDCYIRSFTAFLIDAQAQLTGEIATGYRVKQCRIIKLNNNRVIGTFNPAAGLQFQVFDSDLQPGVNRYQLEVELQDGRKLYSAYEDVYFAGKQPVFVFPTPVKRGQTLYVLTGEQWIGVFSIYDRLGRRLFDKRIVNTREAINTLGLDKGLYFYRLVPDTGKAVSGKFIVD